MPLPKRITLEGLIYHLINRGNNRQLVFKDSADYESYLHIIKKFKERYSFKLYAYCLMSNHIHLILEPTMPDTLSKIMQSITLSYNRFYQKKYNFSGHLWQGRFRSMIIQTDEYLLECLRYVELNPVRAGIVEAPGDYSFSSFNFHAYGQDRGDILDKDPCYLSLGDTDKDRQSAYRKFFSIPQEENLLQRIRKTIESGFVLGKEEFSNELQYKIKLIKPRLRGRPKVKTNFI